MQLLIRATCMQVLARGERIENLVDKTDNLRTQARHRHSAIGLMACDAGLCPCMLIPCFLRFCGSMLVSLSTANS